MVRLLLCASKQIYDRSTEDSCTEVYHHGTAILVALDVVASAVRNVSVCVFIKQTMENITSL